MNKPLVSVIIPTYKRANCLPRAIESVLNQTYSNFEIIVVDDNVPDSKEREETKRVLEDYKSDNRVRYIQHEKNKGGSAARNTGIRTVKGDYVMFLDDDDKFYPQKIEKQVECMESHGKEWGCCYTRYERRDGEKLFMSSVDKREGNMLKEELSRNFFTAAGSNLMIRKSVIDDVGGFDESFVRNQDIEFLIRILSKYKIAYADVLGLCCYVHGYKGVKWTMETITEHFVEMFRNKIALFPENDQKDIYQMINLQLYRYYIFDEKNIRKAWGMIKDEKISVLNSIMYIFYLVERKIRKVSKPYKLR